MSTAVARTATITDHAWLEGYVAHCQRLECSDRAQRDRLRHARAFLAAHPDLHAWMSQPTADRITELKRTHAWPLLVFLIGTGRLRLDLELAGAKNLTGLGGIVEHQHGEDFATARDAGRRLGWTSGWIDTVLHECLATILAWHGGQVADLDEEVVEEFDQQLSQAMQLSRSSLRAYRARLASLRQLLYEIGVHEQPPRRRPWSRILEQRFAEVPMADQIRTVMLRYLQTRASVLRPRSVESLVNDLLPFAEFLTAQHPEVSSLRGLQRSHVEEFLIWNRTRPWRGRKTRPSRCRLPSPSPRCSACATCSRTSRLGMGRGTHRPVGVRRRHSQTRPAPATSPDARPRRAADGGRHRASRSVRPSRAAGAARCRPAGR